MKSRVAERGQVTIPKMIRKKLGIQPGTVLDFYVKDSRLIGVKTDTEDAVSRVFGCLKTHKTTDQIIKELRGD